MYAPGPGEGSDEPKPAARRRATRPASRHRETLRRPQTSTSPLRGPPSAKLLRFPDGRTRLPMAAAQLAGFGQPSHGNKPGPCRALCKRPTRAGAENFAKTSLLSLRLIDSPDFEIMHFYGLQYPIIRATVGRFL